MEKTVLTVETTVDAPINKVWEYWNKPEHITKWAYASDDWHTPWSNNDLKPGGRFTSRMEAKDGSMGFDFGGIYDDVKTNEYIEYTMDDRRKVKVYFDGGDTSTNIREEFEAENTNSLEMQQGGWQAIMNNFKKYIESH